MSTNAFSDLLGDIDSKVGTVMSHAASGISAYVVPVVWLMLAIALLVYSLLVLEGKVNNPMLDWITKGIGMMLVLMACGSYYGTWISATMSALPNGLSAAMGNTGNPNTVLDTLGGNLIDLISGVASGAVDALAGWNIGGGLLLFCAMIDITIVGSLLLVACAFNVLYAKMGLYLVLAVGPFFVMMFMWQQTKNYFYSWLNTALYFVFLSVMSALFVVFFIGIAQTYMDAMKAQVMTMTAAGGSSSYPIAIAQAIKAWATGTPAPASAAAAGGNLLNIVELMLEINFVFVPMFLVAIEMKTLVSSMTSGSGSTAADGVEKAVRMMRG